jgi:hypothetical protein
MGWNLAAFVTFGVCPFPVVSSAPLTDGWCSKMKQAFVVDGNHLTNLMSIGANTTADDELTPGLNIHGNFEGPCPTLILPDNYALITAINSR